MTLLPCAHWVRQCPWDMKHGRVMRACSRLIQSGQCLGVCDGFRPCPQRSAARGLTVRPSGRPPRHADACQPCAGGRTCPATGLPLPDAVRLRAAPQLQSRILAWAAEQGLEVPASPAPGSRPAADARRGRRKARWARARRSVRKFFARLLDESPKLYPGLADMNWAQHL